MKENWLKDELYQRLSQKESSEDLDQLWEELESKRHPRKKSRVIWIWSIPIVLFLALSVYLIQDRERESLVMDTGVEISTNSLEPSMLAPEKKKNSKINESNKLTDGNSLNEDKNDLTNESSDLKRNEENEKTIQFAKSEKEDIDGFNKSKEILLLDNKKGEVFEELTYFETGPSSIRTQEKKAFRLISLIEKLDHSLVVLKTPKRSLDGLPKMTAPIPLLNPIASFKKEHMLGVSGSYGSMSSDLVPSSSKSNGLFTKDYYKHRNEIEKNQDYLDLSLNYTYFFDNNFSIQTGLNYQQYTSKYQMLINDISTEMVIDTIEIYMEGGEIVDAKLGEIPITTTTSSQTTNYIKYEMLRIPILVGYEIHFSDQISMSLASGFSIGLTMIGESRMFNPDPDSVSFLSLEASGYTQTILFESVSQLNLNRNFSNGWVASFGLKYNRDITSRLNNELPANHKLSSLNFVIGLGKRF